MVVIQEIVAALWQHDFAALANPHVVGVVYLVMFATLFLENGLLPASFLPGDSLLLLAGRFLAFVRTLLPTMAGISGLPNRRFQFFNWLSALLWVCVVTGLGYALSMIPFVKRHEDQVMTCLMILPIALLLAGLLGTLFVVIKKKYCSA